MADEKYVPLAKPTTIKATSRLAVKVRDNYVTCEYSEERVIPEGSEPDMDKEREALYVTVNDTLNEQLLDTLTLLNEKK